MFAASNKSSSIGGNGAMITSTDATMRTGKISPRCARKTLHAAGCLGGHPGLRLSFESRIVEGEVREETRVHNGIRCACPEFFMHAKMFRFSREIQLTCGVPYSPVPSPVEGHAPSSVEGRVSMSPDTSFGHAYVGGPMKAWHPSADMRVNPAVEYTRPKQGPDANLRQAVPLCRRASR